MADNDKIRYSDIIEPDDSIERLISQLQDFNKSYETMTNAIRAGAEKIVTALKSVSGATESGRKEIDEAAIATSRLERAEKELAFAMSETGKQVAWLKAQTSDQNKMTVEQQRYINQAIGSYDRLKSDLKENVALFKALSAEERSNSDIGQQVLQTILDLKNQIAALNAQMKPYVQGLSEVEKAEQRLAFLQSEEGQRLIELKHKIAEVTAARKEQKAATDPLAQAQEKLAFAQSAENEQLKSLNIQTHEANRIAKLRAQLANAEEGSYNALAAQYGLNVIALNNMSQATRENTEEGRALEEITRAIRARMSALQEATGNYTLSVGHYQKAWSGLSFSIQQVVRELPAMAVSANTFFLAISNNIPMVTDEIRRLREQNELLRARGEQTVSVTRTIIRSLFSWQSALVVLVSLFSAFGKDILNWIANIFKARNAIISTTKAISNINKELKTTNGSYGQNVVTLKQLQEEWKNLKTEAEKTQWIKDNKTEFDNLGVSVNNVTDAENIFVKNTEAVLNALRLRSKAAAAQKLAEEQYEKALVARSKAETEASKIGTIDQDGNLILSAEAQAQLEAENRLAQQRGAVMQSTVMGGSGVAAGDYGITLSKQRTQDLLDEAEAAEGTGDAYFDFADKYEKAAKKILGAADISENHKQTQGRGPRDLTDTINRNDITIQRKYEESVTELIQDEYAKRRKAAADEVQDENNKLREMYRKNEEYIANVDKKYKELTDSQKEQIAQQQKWITDTLANNLQALDLQLQQIMNEQRINSTRLQRNELTLADTSRATDKAKAGESIVTTDISVSRPISAVESSLVKERKLMEENLDIEYALILETNKKLLAEGDSQARSEEEILIELNKKKLELWADYDKQILNARKRDIEAQLDLVKKGSQDELKLLLQQNENARQIALTQNTAAPASEQQSSATINKQFDLAGLRIRGSFSMDQLDQQQELDEAIFNEVQRSEREISNFKLLQERERWIEQIKLAESGALDWSDKQIEAAKSTVKAINRELNKVGVGEDIKSTDSDIIGGFKGFLADVSDMGLGESLLSRMGLDENEIQDAIAGINEFISVIQDLMQAEIDLAEAAVEAANERVEAAQKALDAEIEARNNGYANNVASAKRELQLEKRNQLEKEKQLAEAQRRQEALNSITQASSLITASANLWSGFSSIPIVGPALAIAAIAAMWASFAAAKIKARQVTAASQEYGEGGLEFLEGGSHASGNDIDLGVKNKKKKRMKAEGGEALAIINKRNTRRYRKVLPNIIDSLNKGTFENKYLNAFAKADNLNVSLNANSTNIDLSKIEDDVQHIRKQNETKYYALPNGMVIIQRKNVKRIIKN